MNCFYFNKNGVVCKFSESFINKSSEYLVEDNGKYYHYPKELFSVISVEEDIQEDMIYKVVDNQLVGEPTDNQLVGEPTDNQSDSE